MPYILQIDFPYAGPWGEEMNSAMQGVAASILEEPGLIWKIWTTDEPSQEAGGIYLFREQASAQAYLTMHADRLKSLGVLNVRAKIFEVHEGLTKLTSGPT
ncbi:monooxygenase [Marinobacter segnicrescens]|uniref:monooxygenase n=1 Tax=Marinobacter segnicrescens TaxID=430453 RepID=UPI003A8D5F2B